MNRQNRKQKVPGYRRIYGSMFVHGLEIEEIAGLSKPLVLRNRGETLSLILNLRGVGEISQAKTRHVYLARTGGLCYSGKAAVEFTPQSSTESSSLIMVHCSRPYLTKLLTESHLVASGFLQEWLNSWPLHATLTRPTSLDAASLWIFRVLQSPPVSTTAANLWFQSQSAQLIALWLFRAQSGKSSHSPRSTSAVQRAVVYLDQNLAQPLDLTALSKEVGFSRSHMSRSFVSEKGMTIQQYLRELRLQKALDMFRHGAHSVSSVARFVGYRSMSYFSKAFIERWGCTAESCLKGSFPKREPIDVR